MERVVFTVVKASWFDKLIGRVRMWLYIRRTARQRAQFRKAMTELLEERRIFIRA